MRFPPEIERMMLEMRVDQLERERARVLADPVKHKLTTLFPEGARMNYHYWPVDKATWPRVRYCYSTERNLAGYFLSWRETVKKDGNGKRDQWIASKRRNTVRDRAEARADAHNARVKPKPRKPVEERNATWWISENTQREIGGELKSCSRTLGKIATKGGQTVALEKARIKWPDTPGELRAFHMGRK